MLLAYIILVGVQSNLLIIISILTKLIIFRKNRQILNSLIWISNLGLMIGHLLMWIIYQLNGKKQDSIITQPEFLIVLFPFLFGITALIIRIFIIKRQISISSI